MELDTWLLAGNLPSVVGMTVVIDQACVGCLAPGCDLGAFIHIYHFNTSCSTLSPLHVHTHSEHYKNRRQLVAHQ